MYSGLMIIEKYEKILKGEQKEFSPYDFQPEHRKERVLILIKYLVEEKLKKTPQEAVETLTFNALKFDFKLDCLLPYVPKPKEATDYDVDYIIHFAYPELPQPTLEQRTIRVYTEVLEGRRKKYPKNYFIDAVYGEERSAICFRYLCESILNFKDENGNVDKDKIVETFLSSKWKEVLKQYKLKLLTDIKYDSQVDMLESAYPNQLDYTKRRSTPIQIVD